MAVRRMKGSVCGSLKMTCIRVFKWLIREHRRRTEEDLLQLYYIHRKASPEDIAKRFGWSVKMVKEKLIKYDMMNVHGVRMSGTFLGVFTGRFHTAKADLIAAIKTVKRTGKVIQRTDELYTQTRSINARILKEIVDEMAELDDDTTAFSAGAALGMTRKETWVAGAHFGIVLADIDVEYAERIDCFLKKVIERKDEFYFDAQSDPENWYPHRNEQVFNEYIAGRTFGREVIEKLKETGGSIQVGV